ncbi:protein phosphatase 2c domain-containing protein [Cystoisospora suis]|uniref:Protein phosphatase 2c domain-containing protein n=1 Tax=Cystoisospora suis TaxID=483139 RepID=A0A2C6KKQ9_9APIC|nr:protein phosphatase 2c domain-containing protein [Cystoisospora suis]
MGLALVKDLPSVIPEWILEVIRRLHGTFFPEGPACSGGGKSTPEIAPSVKKALTPEEFRCSTRLRREWYSAKTRMAMDAETFKLREDWLLPLTLNRFQQSLILGVPLTPRSEFNPEDDEEAECENVERAGEGGIGRRRLPGLNCDLVVGNPCLEVVYGSFSRQGAAHDNEDRLSVAYWGGSRTHSSFQCPPGASQERREESRVQAREDAPRTAFEGPAAASEASRLGVPQGAKEIPEVQSNTATSSMRVGSSIESPVREEQHNGELSLKREAADGGAGEKQASIGGASQEEEAAPAVDEGEDGSSWSKSGNFVLAGLHALGKRLSESMSTVQDEDQTKEGFKEFHVSESSDLEGDSGAMSSTEGAALDLAGRGGLAANKEDEEDESAMLRLASVTPGYKQLEEQNHLASLQKDRKKKSSKQSKNRESAEENVMKKRPLADMEESPCFMTPEGCMFVQRLPAKRAGDDLLMEMPFVAAKRTRACHQAALTTSEYWHNKGKKRVQGWGYTALPCPERPAQKRKTRGLLKDPYDHDDPTFVFTMCDGHDGPTAAVFAALELPKLLAGQGDSAAHASCKDRNTGGLKAMKKRVELTDSKKESTQTREENVETKNQHLKDAFHDLDQRFRRECKQIAAETGRSCTSGACVISVVVQGDEVICQNVGDCKAAMITINFDSTNLPIPAALQFFNPKSAEEAVEVRDLPGPSDYDLSSESSTEGESEEDDNVTKEEESKRKGEAPIHAMQHSVLPDLRRGLTKLDPLPEAGSGQEPGGDEIPGESRDVSPVSSSADASMKQMPGDGLPPSVARPPSISPSVKWLSKDRTDGEQAKSTEESGPENKAQSPMYATAEKQAPTAEPKKKVKKGVKSAAPRPTKPLVLQWLNFEQRCTERREMERLRKAGSVVIGGRMGGVLEPSRTIGDFDVKDVQPKGALSTEPEVTRVRVKKPSIMLIATDGVWDCVTTADIFEVLQKVREFWNVLLEEFHEVNDDGDKLKYGPSDEDAGPDRRRPQPRLKQRFNQTLKADVLSKISEELIKVARKRGSEDDATCMAIFLNPAAPSAK